MTEMASWVVLIGPLAVCLAAVMVRKRPALAMAILCIGMLTVFEPAYQALDARGIWPAVAGLVLYAGVCWVTGNLGRRLPLRWSALWIGIFVITIAWALDFDVPLAILGVGWWLVGVTFQHHQRLTDRLRERADELAAEQQRFTAEAVRLERARIARELHDVVAHCMTVIVIQARAGRQQTDRDSSVAVEALDAIITTSAEAESDLDTLVGVLDPQQSRPLTRELLDGLVRRAASGGTPVRLAVRGDLASLDPVRAAVAHRVIQEALTNALRYASGAEVTLTLDCRQGLALTVENEPATSVKAPTLGSGRGLAGIDERAAALGGTTAWGPTPSGGWQLQVCLS